MISVKAVNLDLKGGWKMQRVMIRGKMPSLNEYIEACRRNPYLGASMKRNVEQGIAWQAIKLKPIDEPCYIIFVWREETKRRDKDNIANGKKFILDALQKAGKLKNDNNRYILGFEDRFLYGKEQGVELMIYTKSEIEAGGRLTDREVAEKIKDNIAGLRAKGVDVDMSDLRYVKLAEFENEQELRFGGKLGIKAMDKGVVEK